LYSGPGNPCGIAQNPACTGLVKVAGFFLSDAISTSDISCRMLPEVLNAQRTYNDLQTSYYETLYNCYAALVDPERAAGIWDIDL